VPDRVKPQFVIFDIWALWRSGYPYGDSGRQRVEVDKSKQRVLHTLNVSILARSRKMKDLKFASAKTRSNAASSCHTTVYTTSHTPQFTSEYGLT